MRNDFDLTDHHETPSVAARGAKRKANGADEPPQADGASAVPTVDLVKEPPLNRVIVPAVIKPSKPPRIFVVAGEVATMTAAALDLLAKEPNPFEAVYVRGRMLVRVIRYKENGKTKDGIERADGSILLDQVIPDWLTLHFNRRAEWRGWKKLPKNEGGGMAEVARDAPEQIARMVMADAPWNGLPKIKGVINAPTITLDGRIIQEPGYDKESQLLFIPDGTVFPKIPEKPTREDALEALKILRWPFKDFPFADKDQTSPTTLLDGEENLSREQKKAKIYERRCATVSAAAALSSVITAIVRKNLRTAPQFGFDAPSASNGKTLLASCSALTATGRMPMVIAPNTDAQAEKKALFAALLEGPSGIIVDNIDGEYGSSVLCAILTLEEYSDRYLGASKQVMVPTNATFSCTGNNLVILGDLGERTILCRIDAEKESPSSRSFDVNLHEELPKRRAAIVSAALTIVKAYLVAGSPWPMTPEEPKKKVDDNSKFPEWQKLCRFPLIWLGCADPCESRKFIKQNDPMAAGLKSVIAAWLDVHENTQKTAADVVNEYEKAIAKDAEGVTEQKALRSAFASVTKSGRADVPKVIGNYIRTHAGALISLDVDETDKKPPRAGEYRFINAGKYSGAVMWKVEKVEKARG